MLSLPVHIIFSSVSLPSGWCLILPLFLSEIFSLFLSSAAYASSFTSLCLSLSLSSPSRLHLQTHAQFLQLIAFLSLCQPNQGFGNCHKKAPGLPPHPQQLPPTFLCRAQLLVSHIESPAVLLRWDLRLAMVYCTGALPLRAAQATTVSVVSYAHSWAQEKRSLVLHSGLKYALSHVFVFLWRQSSPTFILDDTPQGWPVVHIYFQIVQALLGIIEQGWALLSH